MVDDFYRAFEDRHRGSRAAIKSRLRVYLPFVEALKALCPDCDAVDLGCGRGEWLELMGDVGVDARGVDLDEGMLEACRESGLVAERGEAIAFLGGLAAGRVGIVSAFHVVEHIAFGDLQVLVREALRALKPGGLLIMETPNPENLVVGTWAFYLDPTHRRPIPSLLLSFLAEHTGFARVKVLGLQEAAGLANAPRIRLADVVWGVSPDYAVVAQKACETAEQASSFDEAFEQKVGVELGTLVARYEEGLTSQLNHLQGRVDQLAAVERQLAETQHQLAQTQQQLLGMLASRSWQITAPLRWTTMQLRLLRERGLRSRGRALGSRVGRELGGIIGTRPALKQSALRLASWVGLEARLRRLYKRLTLGLRHPGAGTHDTVSVPRRLRRLTPRARRVYRDLTAAIDKRRAAQR